MSGKCLWLDDECEFWKADAEQDGGSCTAADLKDCPIEQMAMKAKKQGRMAPAVKMETNDIDYG